MKMLSLSFLARNWKRARSILLLGFLFWGISAFGQNNYKRGYIITQESDTSYGWVNELRLKKKYYLCKFKKNLSMASVTYFPEDLLGYGFQDGRVYISDSISLHSGEKGQYFIQVISRGKVSLLQLFNSYFLGLEDSSYVELYKESQKVRRNGGEYIQTTKQYENQLRSTLTGCPYVSAQIDSDLQFDTKSLAKLIGAYNSCLGYPEYTYLMPKPKGNLEWEFRVGSIMSTVKAPFSHTKSIRIGGVGGSDTLTQVLLWARREKFKTSIKPSFEVAGKLFVNTNHSVYLQSGLSLGSANLEWAESNDHPCFVYDEIQIKYWTFTLPFGVGKRFHFGQVYLDFTGGLSAHFWRNIRSRGSHEIRDPFNVFPENWEWQEYESYLKKSNTSVSVWSELTLSPFDTSFGRVVMGAKYHWGQRRIPVDSETTGLNRFESHITFQELSLFAGISL